MVWLRAIRLPLPTGKMCRLENSQSKCNGEFYSCICQSVISDWNRMRKSVTLIALTMDGDCVLDFCLQRDSYDSSYSITNKTFSALIDGGADIKEFMRLTPFSK